jgi:hypothetical protein
MHYIATRYARNNAGRLTLLHRGRNDLIDAGQHPVLEAIVIAHVASLSPGPNPL